LLSDISIIQQAPSFILEALADVIVPCLSKEGFNLEIAY
jgi:hypothetical protein